LRTDTKRDCKITFENKTVEYNGEVQSITAEGAASCLGLVVTYVGNGKTAVGVYPITASFATDNANYNTPASMAATLTITKATVPTPTGLTAIAGQTLADVTLPAGWAWEGELTTSVGAAGAQTHKAKFTPSDAANYNALTNIDVTITVNDPSPIRTPQIAGSNIRAYANGNSIVLQNLPAGAKVEVFNLKGKLVYSNRENPLIGGIGVQTKGMYIVKVTSRGVSNTFNVLRVAVK
jgi:hypothetical protein